MAGFKSTHIFHNSPQELYEFIIDVDNAAKVQPLVKEVKVLTSGTLRVGSKLQETRHQGGKDRVSDYEVVEMEPHRRFAILNRREGIEALYRYTLELSGVNTKATLECEVSGEGAKRLLVWAVALAMRQEDGDLLARIDLALHKPPADREGENAKAATH